MSRLSKKWRCLVAREQFRYWDLNVVGVDESINKQIEQWQPGKCAWRKRRRRGHTNSVKRWRRLAILGVWCFLIPATAVAHYASQRCVCASASLGAANTEHFEIEMLTSLVPDPYTIFHFSEIYSCLNPLVLWMRFAYFLYVLMKFNNTSGQYR